MTKNMAVRGRGSAWTWPGLFLSLLLAAGCEGEKGFRVVEVRYDGEDPIITMDLMGLTFPPMEEGGWARIPIREGDLIPIGNLSLPPTEGDTLDFALEDGCVRTLNGRPVALRLGEEDEWDWLEAATPDQLSNIRVLDVRKEIPPERFPLLERLASWNPRVSLYLETAGQLPWLLSLFDPTEFSSAEYLEPSQTTLLSKEDGLRTLILGSDEVSDLRFLARIPRLERLYFGDWNPEEIGPLPDSLPALRSLILVLPTLENLNALGIQPALRELTLTYCAGDSEGVDISALRRQVGLEVLRLPICITQDLSPLDGLRHLRWLALPLLTTQEQLEHVVLTHPDLEVLELIGSEDITDLTPMTRLKKLKALMVGANAPLDPLLTMDRLEYLGVSVANDEHPSFGPEALPRLQAALPNTAVGRVDVLEFCLGSGYILLLFPLVACAWWAVRGRKSRRAHA